MNTKHIKTILNIILITLMIPILILIIGCNDINNNIILMHPKGEIGLQERSLTLITLTLMLIIVIPVITMTIIFSIKYKSSNINKNYIPKWSNHYKIEIASWSIPIIIIIILAILTWKSTHKLDPQKSILSDLDPITIQVVALDWKWLFIYPKEGIATINEIVFPQQKPLKFDITSNSVMNSFFIPQLGSQIYAMAGMRTTLNLIANQSGIYKGISSNFSGHGFSGMKFIAIATNDTEEFNKWIKIVKQSPKTLDSIENYEKLAQPTEQHPIEYFSIVKPNLFYNIIDKFTICK